MNFDVDLYGSFCTGLWLKHCDIDIILRFKDQYAFDIKEILDKMEIFLKK